MSEDLKSKVIDTIDSLIPKGQNSLDMRTADMVYGITRAKEAVLKLFNAESTQTNAPNTLEALDTISRQAAIDDLHGKDPSQIWDTADVEVWINAMPSAQPERLTDDDFETIRIHLNAYKEKLCNQQRWEEADEYQRIIDRFMALASAQPEPEPTMEEFMYGQDLGSPEDGSL